MRTPLTSTLFPYTTLFRSHRARHVPAVRERPPESAGPARRLVARTTPRARLRSEEHTSELQSQSNLVCRLLLEKKHQNRRCRRLDEYTSESPYRSSHVRNL